LPLLLSMLVVVMVLQRPLVVLVVPLGRCCCRWCSRGAGAAAIDQVKVI
jgi:hypothetical protein